MKISAALNITEKAVISLVGGGGKTTIMYRLAAEIPEQSSVLITTTTKIYIPPRKKYPCFCYNDKGFTEIELIKALEAGQRPVLGSDILPDNKLNGVDPGHLSQLSQRVRPDYILVEADGSKGRPLKGHLAYEPVIPSITTLLLIVIGADVFGKKLDSAYVHRPLVVADLLQQRPGTLITPESVARLITHPQGVLAACSPSVEKVVIINKMDYLNKSDEAYSAARRIIGGCISKVILCSSNQKESIIDIIE